MALYVDLETTRAIDNLAREQATPCPGCAGSGKITLYPHGLADWLREYRGGSGPSLCWMQVLPDDWYLYSSSIELTEIGGCPTGAYIHAITWLEALDFCEQVLGWQWRRGAGGRYWAEKGTIRLVTRKATPTSAALIDMILARLSPGGEG